MVSLAAPLGVAAQTDRLKILVIGDSMMSWNSGAGNSIPDVMARQLNAQVESRARAGAKIKPQTVFGNALGLDISRQDIPGDWDWIVVNGGANDLIFRCNCRSCEGELNALIDPTGQIGQLPYLLFRLRLSGARVLYSGYHRPIGIDSPYKACRDEVEELERRVANFSSLFDGIYFADVSDVLPPGDTSNYRNDRIHPSPKGSAALGRRLANILAGLHE